MKKRIKFSLVVLSVMYSSGIQAASHLSPVEIVKSGYESISSTPEYKFKATVSGHSLKGNTYRKDYEQHSIVSVKRPIGIRVDTEGDLRNRTNYLYDGKYTMVDNQYKFYGEIFIPKPLNEGLDAIFEKYNINPPLSPLLYSNMEDRIDFKKGKYYGEEKVGKINTEHISFDFPEKKVHVWISKSKAPMIIAYSIFDEKNKKRTDIHIEWEDDPKIQKKDFIFVPGEEFHKVSVKPKTKKVQK